MAHRLKPSSSLLAFLIATLFLFLPADPGFAQPMSIDTPEDSPLWWTLSLDLSPAELRAQYRDPSGSSKRYQEAVDRGLAEPLSELGAANLGFYQNFEIDPQLMPMWLALEFLARLLERVSNEAAEQKLARSEISPEGQGLIVAALRHLRIENREMIAAMWPKQDELQRICHEAEKEGHPVAALERALANKDVEFFAAITSRSKSEIEDLLEAMETEFLAIASAATMVELEKTLSTTDWDCLRSLLLTEVASGRGGFIDMN